jgi:glucose/arabinose dehydrogenase
VITLNPNFDERGLLGLAFHPHYKNNGKFYVYYSAPPTEGANVNNIGTVSEFMVSSSNPHVADIGSERILLEVPDPQGNHNGGTIAFGPDNYLYIAIGDGGGANDVGPGHVDDWYEVNEGGNGQDIVSNLMGNILRIDVDSRSARMGYGIPSDNPFVNQEGRDEIYAFGLRNPYRFSFDMGGQHWLIVGDVGQRLYEEINVVTKGGNYGWNVKEGKICFDAANPTVPLADCPDQDTAGRPLIDPVIAITNINNPNGGLTSAVIGGHVYRGWDVHGLHGKYIFGFLGQGGDQPDGKLLVTTPSDADSWTYEDLKLKSFPNNLGQYVKGFGQDSKGEVYVTTGMNIGPSGNTGKVYKLVEVK